jgi:hypothetical protein
LPQSPVCTYIQQNQSFSRVDVIKFRHR